MFKKMRFKSRFIQFILFLPFVIYACGNSMPEDNSSHDTGYRNPAVSGQFYSDDPEKLKNTIELFFTDAIKPKSEKPVSIIVPHAGYIYSGQIAADAYNQATGYNYDLIVILGTNHTTAGFDKISVYAGKGYKTPLGIAEIDQTLAKQLIDSDPDIVFNPDVHESEHSVEVQIPFIQYKFPGIRIVTAIIGHPGLELCQKFGKLLAKKLRDKNALIVASSDLSHYPSFRDANRVDKESLEMICNMDPELLSKYWREKPKTYVPQLSTRACGKAPVLSTIYAAKELGANCGKLISYANSGHLPISNKDRVVGYGAVVFCKSDNCRGKTGEVKNEIETGELIDQHKIVLLKFARKNIEQFLRNEIIPLPRTEHNALTQKQGAFVTLKKNGHLRGCIGHMSEDQPLYQVVGNMALAAAFQDRRFSPLKKEEIDNIEIEISVLTPAKTIKSFKEIVIGRDGVILSKDGYRAVFLPQVAPEQGWSRKEMLEHLSQKAGLSKHSWKNARLSVFQAIVFHESDFE